jgi:hypothetical protein
MVLEYYKISFSYIYNTSIEEKPNRLIPIQIDRIKQLLKLTKACYYRMEMRDDSSEPNSFKVRSNLRVRILSHHAQSLKGHIRRENRLSETMGLSLVTKMKKYKPASIYYFDE